MTTTIVDDAWFDKARKAIEDAAQDAAANSPLFKAPRVEVQPYVDLIQWRVMRLTTEIGPERTGGLRHSRGIRPDEHAGPRIRCGPR